VRTSARGIQPFISGLERCHSEVNNFDVMIPVHQDVFWLQVSMADVEAVAIGQASNQLAEYSNGFWFWEADVGRYVVKKFAALHILQDKIPVHKLKRRL